jgi:hypothetical protein
MQNRNFRASAQTTACADTHAFPIRKRQRSVATTEDFILGQEACQIGQCVPCGHIGDSRRVFERFGVDVLVNNRFAEGQERQREFHPHRFFARVAEVTDCGAFKGVQLDTIRFSSESDNWPP